MKFLPFPKMQVKSYRTSKVISRKQYVTRRFQKSVPLHIASLRCRPENKHDPGIEQCFDCMVITHSFYVPDGKSDLTTSVPHLFSQYQALAVGLASLETTLLQPSQAMLWPTSSTTMWSLETSGKISGSAEV